MLKKIRKHVNNKQKHIRKLLKSKSKLSKSVLILFVLFLFVVIPLTVFITLQGQNIQQRAQTVPPPTGPDLDVLYIERNPKYNYDAPKGWPAPNDTVTFVAHVKNMGTVATGNFTYTWSIDGQVVNTGNGTSLTPRQRTTFSLPWQWQNGKHTVKFEADPNNAITETSEKNNVVEE